ncbi:MAG: glycoside hydrolase family 4 [Caldilineaceae bacterium]|nr:glycoside hydrolase family 4 [Caldilineaceae bacterium]
MTGTKHPKVVVIGAGSLFFGRQAIWQMVHSPHLNTGTLALVETNPERLDKLAKLAEMVVVDTGVSLHIEAANNWKDVLPGADFVVLSFARETVKYRGIDCAISEKYGVRMCSGDTIGPGGIFRAMREFPLILDCARDIETLCPDAWVVNYINPSTVHGIGLRRYAPALKSFALCDSLHMPHIKQRYAQRAGLIESFADYSDAIDAAFDMRIAGVNHFTWMLKAEYEGRDVMPAIAESIRQLAATETDGGDVGAKALYNNRIGHQLYTLFGYVPVCVSHTKEYLPYWQGRGVLADAIPPLSIWETEARYDRHEAMWKQVDGFVSGEIPIADYMTTLGPDHATDIIENMVGGLGKPFYVNTANQGAVTNMNDDAFLELLCDIDMNGPKPRPVGEMPRGLRGLQEVVLDTHELTAEAVATCDHGLLRRAMLTDPLVDSIADADAILAELFELERDMLPEKWYV